MDYVSIIIGIVISIVLCFFGYRLKRIAFAIVWFVIGYNIAQFLLPYVTPFMQGIDQLFINLLPFLVGILCAFIGVTIERACIFLMGIGIALLTYRYLVTYGIVELSWLTFGIAFIIGVAIGTVSVNLIRPAIILLTSYVGGNQLAATAVSLIPAINNATVYMVLIIVFATLGAFYQFKSTKHLK